MPYPNTADGDNVINGRLSQIQIGMGYFEVISLLGQPSGKKTTIVADGKEETWAYGLRRLMTNLLTEQEQFNMGWKYGAQNRSENYMRASVVFTNGKVSRIER